MDYRGKTVLITGAEGFLGRHLSTRLQDICRVCCIGRSSEVDLRDEEQTVKLFERVRPDVVFHLVSASGGSIDVTNVLPHLRDDITTTANCLVAAQRAGVRRFVVPGSTDEPGDIPDSPYAMAKTVCVTYAQMFYKLYGTPTVICRIFMTYGPGQKDRKIVPYIIRSMLAGVSPKLASPTRLVDWIYIDDTIDALLLAGSQPDVEGEMFEIGSGEVLSIEDLAGHVQRLMPGAPPPSASGQPAYGRVRHAHLSRGRDRLGWAPQVRLEEGLRRTIDWYRKVL